MMRINVANDIDEKKNGLQEYCDGEHRKKNQKERKKGTRRLTDVM